MEPSAAALLGLSAVEELAPERPTLPDEPAASKQNKDKPPLPAHKGKKARMGDDAKTAATPEVEAGKGDEMKAPASAGKVGDERMLLASAGNKESLKQAGVDDTSLKVGDDDKAAEKNRDEAAHKENKARVGEKKASTAEEEAEKGAEKLAGKDDGEERKLAASAGKDDGDDRKSSEEPAAGKQKTEKPRLPAAHKGKKARMGDDGKTAATPEDQAGKGDEMKAPASAEQELCKNADERKPAASAGKEGGERKAPASAGKDVGDEPMLLVSAGKKEYVDDTAEALVAGDDKSAEKDGDAPASKDEAVNDDESEAAIDDESEAVNDDESEAANDDEADDDDDEDEDPDPADAVPPANRADAVAPHLPLDIVVVGILSRLPSKEAGRCTLLSKGCEGRLREKMFFNAHLGPRRNFVPDEPSLLVFKPTGRGTSPTGYSHLCMINLASRVVYDMPVRTDQEDYHLWRNPNLPDPMVLDFFHDTITALDLSVLACEGHLLFGYSGKRACFFVCNANNGRFVKLPAPPFGLDTTRAVAAIRVEEEDFSVVLVSLLHGPHKFAVHRFSSARDGPGHGWAVRQWENVELCAVVQAVSGPGVYGTEIKSFCWISRTGTILQYDPEEDRFSLIPPPPPETEAHPIRKGWSIGSTAGRLRVSCFSVGPEAEEEPHLQINMAGLISVWIRSQVAWEPVQNIPVEVQWVLQFFRRLELPIDAARGGSDFIVVKKDDNVLTRPMVVEGGVQLLSNLYRDDDPLLHRMYESFQAFFVYL